MYILQKFPLESSQSTVLIAFNYLLFHRLSIAIRSFLNILVTWNAQRFTNYNKNPSILHQYEYGNIYILFRWRILDHKG